MKKRFAIVYSIIRKRHPNWTHGQLSHCTAYAVGYKKGEKINGKN